MKKINFPKSVCEDLERVAVEKKIYLEGNILKIIESSEYPEFSGYIEVAKENDSDNRRKRLDVTRTVQDQNKELIKSKEENESLMFELREALNDAESAKKAAEEDLDILQKKRQFELIGSIVNFALYVIAGIGIATTLLYVAAIFFGSPETTIIGSTWANLFGILLTNSFSIVGTIMGVKYAEGNSKKGC